jgi:glycosyltransferase involved in cell wall biosynthesis
MTVISSRITVIIPTYNWSAVLPYSIASVLRQTVTNFELLVVGDGCTDDSESVVERVGDKRVRWINLPANTGHQSGPNNEGLRQARGEFIAYLGHDDLWFPHHLSCLVAALDAGADLAFGITELIGPDDSYRRVTPPKPRYVPRMWIAPTGMVHRRMVTDTLGGWRHYRDVKDDPEIDLWHRAHVAGHTFAFVPRLTALKFPAAHRPDVYKKTPHHEQARWFERICHDPALEQQELGRLLALDGAGLRPETPYIQLLKEFLYETAARSRRRVARLAHRGWVRGEQVEARRLRKGLERKG